MLWQVTMRDNTVVWGDRRRTLLTANGCNEPFKGRFWCPRKKWFRTTPCPFASRHECGAYQRMCMAP
ncbi:MAG: hypothetical protein AB7E47_17640 [Desulfovibrionaceae bacterium]